MARKLDRFDQEAEREGNAIGTFRKSFAFKASGKRIMKIRRGHQNGQRLIQTKIERRHSALP